MTEWTKESALKELDALVNEIEPLKQERAFSSAHTRWSHRALRFLSETFGADSTYASNLCGISWGRIGSYMLVGHEALNPEPALLRKEQNLYVRQLDYAKGMLQAASDEISAVVDILSLYKGKNTAPEASAIIKVINLAERRLRKVIRAAPTAEKEVQEGFENLLVGAEIDYSREAESFEYSSKSYIPDFTVQKSDLAIEIKLCHRAGREKEIIAEINDDIVAYKTRYGNLMFVVYDCGFIRDIDRFSGHFEMNDNVIVVVVKH